MTKISKELRKLFKRITVNEVEDSNKILNLNRTLRRAYHVGATIQHQLFDKNSFRIIDNGHDNLIHIPNNNKVIGKSIITMRKGNNNQISIGNSGKFNNLKIDINGNHNTVTIGDKVKFSGQLLIVGNHLSIHIGHRTTAIECYVLAREKSVHIGSECMLSRGIEIRTSDVHKIFDLHANEQLNQATNDVRIGNHVWITANVTVSKNVSIADGCIIAAGSFVNKPFDIPNVLIAGSPAKIIKENIRWER